MWGDGSKNSFYRILQQEAASWCVGGELRLDAGENPGVERLLLRDQAAFLSGAAAVECVNMLMPFTFTDFCHHLFFKS